jgi:hypothetical protein
MPPILKAYAGIGSRTISDHEYATITQVAAYLADHGWTCYSGNAPGADQAFGDGAKGDLCVWLPWWGFEFQNHSPGNTSARLWANVGDDPDGLAFVDRYHPAPGSLSDYARAFMARNAVQVMGYSWEDSIVCPRVSFVICCADPLPDGTVKGGTGQAVRIAIDHGIPVINIRTPQWQDHLNSVIQ